MYLTLDAVYPGQADRRLLLRAVNGIAMTTDGTIIDTMVKKRVSIDIASVEEGKVRKESRERTRYYLIFSWRRSLTDFNSSTDGSRSCRLCRYVAGKRCKRSMVVVSQARQGSNPAPDRSMFDERLGFTPTVASARGAWG